MPLYDKFATFAIIGFAMLSSISSQAQDTIFPGQAKIIEYVDQKITRKECWIVANYLAQRAPKPIQAQSELAKIGGHPKNFKCLSGLKFWLSTILPPKLDRVKQKEQVAKKQLQQALGFAGCKDVRDWVQAFDINSTPVPATTILNSSLSGQIKVTDISMRQSSPVQSRSGAVVFRGQKGNKNKGKRFKPTERVVSTTPETVEKQVIKYVVLSVIGVVSLCLTIAIACSCRRRGARNAVDDEAEGQFELMSTQSAVSSVRGLGLEGDNVVPGPATKLTKDNLGHYSVGRNRTILTVENGDNLNNNPANFKPTLTAKRI